MIRFTPSCKFNVNGQCSKLRVKCLESRFMGIGGVEFGHCTIRETVPFPPMPKGVKRPAPQRISALAQGSPAKSTDNQCKNCMVRHMVAVADGLEKSGDMAGAFVLRKMAEPCLGECCGAKR